MSEGLKAYIEHDGRVLTVRHEGQRTLPDLDDVDIHFEERGRLEAGPHSIVIGAARLDEHPRDWLLKDDVPLLNDAAPVLRAAVLGSLYRPVVGVVAVQDGAMLLVMPSRGVAEGRWTLPGGFMEPFESPEHAARREVREETGLVAGDLDLLGAWLHNEHVLQFPVLGLGYVTSSVEGTIETDPDEIADVQWMPLDEAAGSASGIARDIMDRWGDRIRGMA